MDLTTTYLGLKLKNPLIVSASPLSEDINNFRRMEDAGAACIVHYSLFEEQITREIFETDYYQTFGTESFAESLSYFPEPAKFALGPEEYCEHIRAAKAAVDIPVIGSLNGHTIGGWTKYAKNIEQAGADALELNIYYLPTDPDDGGIKVEQDYLDIVRSVRKNIRIPIAVKLSPYFSAMASMAKRLSESGADGLVLFNRFYQPDINLEHLEIVPNLILSNKQDLRLPLRWVAILYGKIKADMAATGGVHTAEDVIKMLLVGAKATMMCSALLRQGIGYLDAIRKDVIEWMEAHEYTSIEQLQGSMSQVRCTDPELFERANYIKVLRSYNSRTLL